MNKRIIAIALSTLLVGLMMGIGFVGIAPDKVQAAFTTVFPKPEPCAAGEIWNGSQCTSVQTLYDKCREKSADQQEFCMTIVDSRLKETGAFLATKRFVQPAPAETRTFKVSMPKAISVSTAAKRFTSAEKATIEAHVYQEILAGIPKLEITNPPPKYICRVADLGWTRCVGTDAIVGFVDNVQAAEIIKDIETMVGRLTQEEKNKGILISCPLGRYGTATVEELLGLTEGGGINLPLGNFGLSGTVDLPPTFEKLLGGSGDNAFTKFCRNLESGTGTGSKSGGIDGFGVIGGGFGSFDGAFCGFQLSGGSLEVMNVADEAFKMAEEANKYCATAPNASWLGDVISTVVDWLVAAAEKVKDVVTTEGSEAVKVVQQVATTIKVAVQDITKNREIKKVLQLSKGTVIIHYTNGASTSIWKAENGNTIIHQHNKKGKTKSRAEYNEDGLPLPELESPSGSKDCLDEQCNTCRDFAQFFPKSFEACQLSGSTSLACQRFEDMQGCCGNSGRFPGDPRIMLPNPDGDLFCMGTPNLSLRDEFCTQECSRATPADGGDCRSACLSGPSVSEMREKFKSHLWDDVCQHGLSENCFQSAGLPLPNTPRPANPPNVPNPPKPFETDVLSPLDRSLAAPSHTLLPTTAFDRHGPAVTSDMFPDIGIQPPDGVGHQPPDGVPDDGGNKPF